MSRDVVDATQEIEDHLLSMRIAAIAAASNTRKLPVIGRCHWCDEDFAPNSELIFCDSDCSEDYEKYQRNHRPEYD